MSQSPTSNNHSQDAIDTPPPHLQADDDGFNDTNLNAVPFLPPLSHQPGHFPSNLQNSTLFYEGTPEAVGPSPHWQGFGEQDTQVQPPLQPSFMQENYTNQTQPMPLTFENYRPVIQEVYLTTSTRQVIYHPLYEIVIDVETHIYRSYTTFVPYALPPVNEPLVDLPPATVASGEDTVVLNSSSGGTLSEQVIGTDFIGDQNMNMGHSENSLPAMDDDGIHAEQSGRQELNRPEAHSPVMRVVQGPQVQEQNNTR